MEPQEPTGPHHSARRHEKPGTDRLDRLALGSFLLWSVGAGLTPRLGIPAGLGAAAIGLGIAALGFASRTLLPLLRPSPRLVLWGLAAGLVMLGVTYGLYPWAVSE